MRLLSRLFGFAPNTRPARGAQLLRFRPRAEVLEDRTVPAFLRVDPNFPFFFPTIQSAINFAHPGDIIAVDQATYNEDIVINKQLTLLGQGNSNGFPSIKGPGAAGAENIVRIADGVSGVVLNGFDIQSPNGTAKFQVGVSIGVGDANIAITNNSIHDVRDATRAVGGGTLTAGILINPKARNLQIRNNQFSNILYSTQGVGSGGQTAFGIFSFSVSPLDGQNTVVISSNAFTNIGDIAIAADDASQHITIDNNSITNVVGLRRGEGIEVAGPNGTPANVLITHNMVTGVAGGQPVGVLIGGSATGVSMQFNTITGISGGVGMSLETTGVVTVIINLFTNNAIGIALTPSFSGILKLTANNISGNSVAGLFNASGKHINAELNWWGSATGPTNPANPFGIGDRVFGNVDFFRFLFAPITF